MRIFSKCLLKPSLILSGLICLLNTSLAHADLGLTSTPSLSCTSNLVVSLENGYHASCDGDFSFSQGLLQNDTLINLNATGMLTIGSQASLVAPSVTLTAYGLTFLGKIDAAGREVVFAAGNLDLKSGSIINVASDFSIVAGNDINLNSRTIGSTLTAMPSNGGNIVLRNDSGLLSVSGLSVPVINPTSSIIQISAVPEPSTNGLLLIGLGMIFGFIRFKTR